MVISVSTALVSTLTAVLSHQRLEVKIGTLNTALHQLEDTVAWWWDRTFVEQRYPDSKDRLVQLTESAILMEVQGFFTNHHESDAKECDCT